MHRKLLVAAGAGSLALAGTLSWWGSLGTAQAPRRAASDPIEVIKQAEPQLPVSDVVLFSSGVGYFHRQGEVEDNTRVDLSFPATGINDLLKSLVLQDLGGGTVSAVNYDSQDPLDKTLKSFALDLTGNPTFGQLLNQARGEKLEVVLLANSTQPQGTYTGTIVGLQAKQQPHGKDQLINVEHLNLLCADGLRDLPLTDIQKVRFLNPNLEAEFRRALAVLAGAHDQQKKLVSLSFSGKGKRTVRVGYVAEAPIWKTSYRLNLAAGDKARLQGWAIVENTTDDDWSNVRLALVSGRPISFQMDLYQPLYVPRPTVEPELFASLRPPTYSGALGTQSEGSKNDAISVSGGFGRLPGGGGGAAPAPAMDSSLTIRRPMQEQEGLAEKKLGRLSFNELQRRKQNQLGDNRDGKRELERTKSLDSVASVASAEEIGDYFQYLIDHPVSLPRQKSALLPIVTAAVEAKRVSIYNEQVHAKFPLLGLKFRNTSKEHLMQGPITIADGDVYAGDARLPDMQPNEERLVSYAVDLGTEVKAETKGAPQQLVAVKVVKGVLHSSHKVRETRCYLIKNRSEHERLVVLEQPYRSDWHLVTPAKASERSRDVYRFEVTVPAGKSITQEVTEEQTHTQQFALLSVDENFVRVITRGTVASPGVREALQKAALLRNKVVESQRELAQLNEQVKAIGDDQARLRQNLARLPQGSAAYKRYVEKFDSQETELEGLQKRIKQLQEAIKAEQKEFESYVSSLNIE